MHGPVVVGWLLVALGAATGVYCLLRTRPGCAAAAERHSARDEGLMGLGMALMAVPVSAVDPRPWGPPLFAALFGAAAVRALLLARRDGRHVHHAVGAGAMAYMALAMTPAGPAHTGHAPGGVPLLTGLLLVYFAAYLLTAGARLVSVPAVAGPGLAGLPGLTAACRVSMAMGTFAMLLTL